MGSTVSADSPELSTIMMIDTMAQRYGLLPTEVLQRGTTIDAHIMDVSISYQNYLERKSQNRPQDYTTEELQAIVERTRGH